MIQQESQIFILLEAVYRMEIPVRITGVGVLSPGR
jgi:hypothetical protein